MKLIIQELGTIDVTQTLRCLGNTQVVAIRPHLYLHNKPTANLWVDLLSPSGAIIASSEVLTPSQISSATYFHGAVSFNISVHLKADTVYTCRISHSGYTFSEGAYVGVCSEYENLKYAKNYTPLNSGTYPLDIEIWERTRK